MAITSVTVSPSNPFILINGTQQFQAIAHFSDSPDLDVTTDVTTAWVSDTLSVATIVTSGPGKGLATALTISGSSVISATYGGQTGTAILRVGLAKYSRIYEQVVDFSTDQNPVVRLTTPTFSMFSGGVTLKNSNGSSGGTAIGWTNASGHPGDFTKLYIANEEQRDGYWVQLNNSGLATINFSNTQRSLGVVSSISVDENGNKLTSGGNPVLVQIAGEAYVFAVGPINIGDFLVPDFNGEIKATTFVPASPTPIIGYALEALSETYLDMVLMRIQICGE